jgi:multicomponent Na+:H+ antiporter subunit B
MIVILNIIILAAMVATAFSLNKLRSLIGIVMLASIYSLLTALFFFLMDAVDVAFTEAAVGAGISTVIFMSVIGLTTRVEKPPINYHRWFGLVITFLTAIVLIVGTSDLPTFGAVNNPIHNEIASYYIAGSSHDIHIPNVVTSVLGSYRGYDTFGEVVVVFAAVVGVLLLLWRETDSNSGDTAQVAEEEQNNG